MGVVRDGLYVFEGDPRAEDSDSSGEGSEPEQTPREKMRQASIKLER